MKPLLLIVGPTASGKSALAMQFAEQLGGEIVSADSQQVYRGMDIGTGKVSAAERARVPHHALDLVDPDEQMTAARWAEAADRAIADIQGRGKQVIVAGGTGLYVRALLRGLFDAPAPDPALRAALTAEAERDPAALHARLAAVDPAAAARIHATDVYRLVRALEIYQQTGIPLSVHHAEQAKAPRHPFVAIGLSPLPAVRAERIDARVDAMLGAGLLDEVRGLCERGYAGAPAMQAIGYKQLISHLKGEIALDEAVRLVKRDSRRYARRQLAWYRGDMDITWYPGPARVPAADIAERLGA